MGKLKTILLLLIINIYTSKSQGEANNWYFGTAGINFGTNPPTNINNSAMNAFEGSTSISNNLGNLLFYSHSLIVYNKAHLPMANGINLLGDLSTTQSSIAVKKPGSKNIYFLFTLEGLGRPGYFRYSTIDMSLASGNGSVTAKNVTLQDSCMEKLAAVKHCNGRDIWVVVVKNTTKQFLSYLVSTNGVSNSPVVSNAGCGAYDQGYMKISPTGKKLALAAYNANYSYELYDFDSSTGMVSNLISLGQPSSYTYGCEFSPDGRLLYGRDGAALLQWNLCAGSSVAIAASETTVALTDFGDWAMQLAPNGKIYTLSSNMNRLSVINNPNMPGTACNFGLKTFTLTKQTAAGLPNFVSSFFYPTPSPVTYTQSLTSCRQVSFTAPFIPTVIPSCSAAADPYTGFKWIFGDPNSGAANTSTLASPSHTFSTSGLFNVQFVLYTTCGTDTINKSIPVGCASIEENLQNMAVRVFPNPTRSILTIEAPFKAQYEIHDILGNCVLKGDLRAGSQNLSIEHLTEGIYFLNCSDNELSRSIRLLKLP